MPPFTGAMVRTVAAAAILHVLYVLLRLTDQRLPRERHNLAALIGIGILGSAAPFTLMAFAAETRSRAWNHKRSSFRCDLAAGREIRDHLR